MTAAGGRLYRAARSYLQQLCAVSVNLGVCVITASAVPGSDMWTVDAGSDRKGHVVTPLRLDSSRTFPHEPVWLKVCVKWKNPFPVLDLRRERSTVLTGCFLSMVIGCVSPGCLDGTARLISQLLVKTKPRCLCVVVLLDFIHISPRKPWDVQANFAHRNPCLLISEHTGSFL